MDDALRFLEILRHLVRGDVELIVVGGVAAILEGAPMATFDLDLVYRDAEANHRRLAAVLRRLEARYRDPAGRVIRPDAPKLAELRTHLLRTKLGALDLMKTVGDGLNYEDLLPRSIEYEVDDLRLHVLGLEAIIECKEHADRDKDRATLPLLRRTLELKRSAGE